MARIDVTEVKGLIRVGLTSDEKGNEVVALEILGIPVAYADARDLERTGLAADDWEDVFALRLGHLLTKAVTEGYDDAPKWTAASPTGREVRRLSPEDFDD